MQNGICRHMNKSTNNHIYYIYIIAICFPAQLWTSERFEFAIDEHNPTLHVLTWHVGINQKMFFPCLPALHAASVGDWARKSFRFPPWPFPAKGQETSLDRLHWLILGFQLKDDLDRFGVKNRQLRQLHSFQMLPVPLSGFPFALVRAQSCGSKEYHPLVTCTS